LLRARTLPVMGGSSNKRNGGAKSPHQWTAEERLRVVLEASRLSDEELGAFLRTEGLHQSQLEEWRAAVIEALGTRKTRKSKKSPEAKRIQQLEKELLRKDKALAEAAALLVLKKKAQEIWGDEDDDTPTRSGT
jgi:transposase